MPVCLNRDSSIHELLKGDAVPDTPQHLDFRERSAGCIDIGLLNNMPDGALHSTERQFFTLLNAAAGGVVVRLSLFALPEVPRSDSAQDHIRRFYSGIGDLWSRRLDGLIITGTEPRTANLRDEPYWGSMTRVLDWAAENTHSTICSCLAAHAAVLHLDGIERRRLSDKRFGLFQCNPACSHPLTAAIPPNLVMPHSRWNDLPEDGLVACGYRILMRSGDAGADTFVKPGKSPFVFFQGHPEYEANTLMLEYRRDIARYIRGERETYPSMPQRYFDPETAAALTLLRERARHQPHENLVADFPTALAEKNLQTPWRSAAARIYGNWLTFLCARKEERLEATAGRKALVAERDVLVHRSAAAGD